MFVHEWNAVSHGLSTGIVHNGWLKSALAQVNAHGSMSTSTVFECDVGDRVYVQVRQRNRLLSHRDETKLL